VRTAGVAFLASTVTAAALTPAVRALAHRWGFLDHALSSRKVHGRPVPRMGGVAIVCAFFAPLASLYFVDSEVGRRFYADLHHAIGLFIGGGIIAALGIYDDVRGSGARIKFVVQFAVAALMYWLGFRIDHIANPFGADISLGLVALPFTMLWIAGVINAMNLIDGLDGLAGGVALIAVSSTFAIAALHGEPLMLLFTAGMAGAVLGFLFYNFNPATIFMGDTGSMFLGFVLATTAIQTNHKSSTAVSLVVPIIALGVPIADTLLAMIRRALRGVPLFSADRGHIHHRLLALGLTHRQTVMVLYAVCAVLGGIALVLSFANSVQTALFLVALSAGAYLALKKLGFFSWSKARQLFDDRRRNGELRSAIRQVGAALRTAWTPDDVWAAVQDGAAVVGASSVALRTAAITVYPIAVAEGLQALGASTLSARFSLVGERRDDEYLELSWTDGRTEVGRDTEIAVEVLCEHIAVALERVAERTASGNVIPLSFTGSD